MTVVLFAFDLVMPCIAEEMSAILSTISPIRSWFDVTPSSAN
jgi:hypothetical protein